MKFYSSEERQKDMNYVDSLDLSQLENEPFNMRVSDYDIILDVGTVLEGYVSSGMFKVGDRLNVETRNGVKPFIINEVNLIWVPCGHRRFNGCVYKGEKVGLLVRGLNSNDVLLNSVVKSI